jgi:hypothetical protein
MNENLLHRQDGGRHKVIERFLANLTEGGGLRRLLMSILVTESEVEYLSRESYEHDNGFLKLLILQSPDDRYRLRLHFWPKTIDRDQNIHDHRFDFWSTILMGKIINHVWKIGDGELRHHYKYFSRAGKSHYLMRRVSEKRLNRFRCFQVCHKQHYYFDKSWLHTIECEEPAITLMLEDRVGSRPYANVFSASKDNRILSVASPALSKKRYKLLLEKFAEENRC